MKTAAALLLLALPLPLVAGDILMLSPRIAPEKLLTDPRLDIAKMTPADWKLTPQEVGALMASINTPKPNPQLAKYWEEEAKRVQKDPLFHAKVLAAGEVAQEHIGRLQLRGYLHRPSCVRPDEWDMHRPLQQKLQQWILKKKFAIDWSPPPEEPKPPGIRLP
jgi:hypothetical protein